MDKRDLASSKRWWEWTDGRIAHARGYSTKDEDGEPIYTDIPVKLIVCTTCKGKGVYVNPSIDGHGLSREDFDDDPDFAEGYLNHDYDVRCEHCQGANVIPVPVDGGIRKEVQESLDAQEEAYAEIQAEIDFGA